MGNSTDDPNSASLQVTGLADEQQIFESLRRYPKRMRCTQQALYSLFALTHQFTEPRMDAIEVNYLPLFVKPPESSATGNAQIQLGSFFF